MSPTEYCCTNEFDYQAENIPSDALHQHQDLLDDFLTRKELWKLSFHSDPSVRRAVYKILDSSLIKKPSLLNLEVISNCVLLSSLSISQASSIVDYSRVLARLTAHDSSVWTDHYTGTGKKSATKRLCQFLAKGSQGGPSAYWDEINSLLLHIPVPVLLPTEDTTHQTFVVFEALREGIADRNEQRPNQQAAWNAYLKLANRLLSFPGVDRDQLIESTVMPILVQYITPSRETSAWTVSASQPTIMLDAARIALTAEQSFMHHWQNLSKAIIQDIQLSLPEQAKDFAKSQDAISAKSNRWHNLQAALRDTELPQNVDTMMMDGTSSEVESAITLLRARNGKPYGAASLIESAIRSMPDILSRQKNLKDSVVDFVTTDFTSLLLSLSGPYLIRLIPRLEGAVDVDECYRVSLQSVLRAPKSSVKSKALQQLVASTCLAQLDQDQELFTDVISYLQQPIDEEEQPDDIFSTAIANPHASHQLTQALLAKITQGLSLEEYQLSSLRGLEAFTETNRDALELYSRSTEGLALLTRLLSLADSPESNVSQQAKNLSDALQRNPSVDTLHSNQGIVKIIRRSLDRVEPDVLSVPSLIALAQKVLGQSGEKSKGALAAEMLPDEARWKGALQPILGSPPNPSLAIMNDIGTALSLIDPTAFVRPTTYDNAGYSAAFRIFWFTSVLLQASNILEYAATDRRTCIFRNLIFTLQIASDNLSIQSSSPLWKQRRLEAEEEAIEIVSQTQSLVASWLANSPVESSSTVLSELLNKSYGSTVEAYYGSRAYTSMIIELTELHMNMDYDRSVDELRQVQHTADVFAGITIVSAVQDLTILKRLFNEILADLTGDNLSTRSDSLTKIIILNNILNKQDFADVLSDIPKQRLIFFVQHACGFLSTLDAPRSEAPSANAESSIAAELLRVLNQILPILKEMYGSFWNDCLEFLKTLWSGLTDMPDELIPLVHASLRLHSTFKRLRSGESNEDLEDALENNMEGIDLGLIHLLQALQGLSDELHQPRRTVNELLARQVFQARNDVASANTSGLFPVLASESLALQEAAYELLHSQIPKRQENISLEKALSKGYVAKLPEELLSLLIEAPNLDNIADADFKRSIPAFLRSYLLSWKLVFDHWEGASDAVKNDYVNSIKEGSYVDGLLLLASDLLISSRIRPVDASKFDIEQYVSGIEDSPEKDAQWLLAHLYLLALKHLPTLSKTWWRDNTSRQTQISVESWTEKYISPLVTSFELSAVSSWATNRDLDPDQPLTVKVSTSTREINASIPIDEQSMSLAITLPPSYPLARAIVSGVHRVGVTEQKWRSWIITTQGVINFSNIGGGGQLIDGLTTWRKNVTATLKGQSECAICYSVVSADRQLPSKRCGTCKNLFHGSCLFKWFRSSNSSSCPLCRNQFSYA